MLLCDKKARALEKGVPEKKAKVEKLFETNQLILGASFILFYPAGGHIPRSPSLLVSQCTPSCGYIRQHSNLEGTWLQYCFAPQFLSLTAIAYFRCRVLRSMF